MIRVKPVSEWDWVVNLTLRFGWTPEQIGELDPDYLENLMARLSAEAAVQARAQARAARSKG